MKIAFIIDKTQTFPVIARLLKTCLIEKHDCFLFCCFEKKDLGNLTNYFNDYLEKITWIFNKHRSNLVKRLADNRSLFDVVFGINFFNKSLSSIYNTSELNNYSFEYCWNEIYNQQQSYSSSGTIFANTDHSKQIIQNLSGYKKIKMMGSPWYEFISEFKVSENNRSKKIIFMAPHNSYYQHVSGLSNKVICLLEILRKYCDEKNIELWLKTRTKYFNKEASHIKFDHVVSDKIACSNIETYCDALAIINFCSSAVNELAYLEVPYMIVGPEVQKNLHVNRRCNLGITRLHNIYYSGNIIDDIHCTSLSLSNDQISYKVITRKLEKIINSNKQWKDFRSIYFDNTHIDSSRRILEYVENEFNNKKSIKHK